MYSPSQLWRGVINPRRAALELWRVYNRRVRGRTGVAVMEEDWDNLVLLDACRYDLFEKVNDIEGVLHKRVSKGSNTSEFLEKNFSGTTYQDTVYVSANPQVTYNRIDEVFHHTEQLWDDEWDEKHRTVLPQAVVKEAIETQERFPNKRLIVHFLQPHYPFIGESGQNIKHGTVVEVDSQGNPREERDHASVWNRLQEGEVNRETVWRAYEENLELLMPSLKELVDVLVGKTIISSDHGNAFGDWEVYGHPGGRFMRSLVEVPWLVINSEDRPRITSESRASEVRDGGNDEEMQNRLSALGYTE